MKLVEILISIILIDISLIKNANASDNELRKGTVTTINLFLNCLKTVSIKNRAKVDL